MFLTLESCLLPVEGPHGRGVRGSPVVPWLPTCLLSVLPPPPFLHPALCQPSGLLRGVRSAHTHIVLRELVNGHFGLQQVAVEGDNPMAESSLSSSS